MNFEAKNAFIPDKALRLIAPKPKIQIKTPKNFKHVFSVIFYGPKGQESVPRVNPGLCFVGHFGPRIGKSELRTLRDEEMPGSLTPIEIPKSNDEFEQCAALAHQLLEVALKARDSR